MQNIEKELKSHISNMLNNILTQAELKTLARSKGIAVSGLDKDVLVGLVEEKFLSTDLPSEQYKDLAPEYHFLLHYLKANREPIELKRASMYLEDWEVSKSREWSPYYGRKEFRRFFTQFKTDLAVKGLIVIMESIKMFSHASDSTFERYSFFLPEAFFPFLLPLRVQGEKKDKKVMPRSFEAFAKNILLSSLGLRNPLGPMEKEIAGSFPWKEGIPYFQGRPIFRPGEYIKHLYTAWAKPNFYDNYPLNLDTAANVFYILEGLPEGEWISLQPLHDFFRRLTRIFHHKETEKILSRVCDEAAAIGLLEKIDTPGVPFYRLHAEGFSLLKGDGEIPLQGNGISLEGNGSLRADIDRISLFALFELLLISDWKPSGNALLFSPSPVKLGKVFRVFSDFSKLGIYEYLTRNSLSYKQAFQKVEKSFGKYMIHSNLSIFEITDVTISALLTHTFPESFIPIGGDFFAVSERNEGEIVKFLDQRKYSIKINTQGA
jgi:hypothetical protein